MLSSFFAGQPYAGGRLASLLPYYQQQAQHLPTSETQVPVIGQQMQQPRMQNAYQQPGMMMRQPYGRMSSL